MIAASDPAGRPPAGIERARRFLAEADGVLVLTGAGISADSGVPTFRGEGGLWRQHRPEELATPQAFARDPRLVWEWYEWRRRLVADCDPNSAHVALARWQARGAGVRIVTQNVDGLHGRAASDTGVASGPELLLELHGSLSRTRCTSCDARRERRDPIDTTSAATLPHCAGAGDCRGLLRPDVVWFGESLDPAVIGAAFGWAETADVCLVVGTSAVVQPAASLAAVTREAGGALVEVNPEPTPLTWRAAVSIRGGAADVVPRIVPGDQPSATSR